MSVTFKALNRHFKRGRTTSIRITALMFLLYYSFARIYKYDRETEKDTRTIDISAMLVNNGTMALKYKSNTEERFFRSYKIKIVPSYLRKKPSCGLTLSYTFRNVSFSFSLGQLEADPSPRTIGLFWWFMHKSISYYKPNLTHLIQHKVSKVFQSLSKLPRVVLHVFPISGNKKRKTPKQFQRD